jgi:hypothetical protein
MVFWKKVGVVWNFKDILFFHHRSQSLLLFRQSSESPAPSKMFLVYLNFSRRVLFFYPPFWFLKICPSTTFVKTFWPVFYILINHNSAHIRDNGKILSYLNSTHAIVWKEKTLVGVASFFELTKKKDSKVMFLLSLKIKVPYL